VWVIVEPLTEQEAWLHCAIPFPPSSNTELSGVSRSSGARRGILPATSGPSEDGARLGGEARRRFRSYDYEAQLNAYLADKAMLVLCFYPVPAGRAADVSRTHPSTVSKRQASGRRTECEKSLHQVDLESGEERVEHIRTSHRVPLAMVVLALGMAQDVTGQPRPAGRPSWPGP